MLGGYLLGKDASLGVYSGVVCSSSTVTWSRMESSLCQQGCFIRTSGLMSFCECLGKGF